MLPAYPAVFLSLVRCSKAWKTRHNDWRTSTFSDAAYDDGRDGEEYAAHSRHVREHLGREHGIGTQDSLEVDLRSGHNDRVRGFACLYAQTSKAATGYVLFPNLGLCFT